LEKLHEKVRAYESMQRVFNHNLTQTLQTHPSRTATRLIFLSTGEIPKRTELLPFVEQLVENLRSVLFGARPFWVDDAMNERLSAIQAKHPNWLQDMADIASAIHIQQYPEALGSRVAGGQGPQDLIRKEQIQFLADQERSRLLAQLGFMELKRRGSLSDLTFSDP
jgi:hypothetical protein